MKQYTIILATLLSLLIPVQSWGEKIQDFDDWMVYDSDTYYREGPCYIVTRGTHGDLLYRSFEEDGGIQFSIRSIKPFTPNAEFFLLIDNASRVSIYSHPNPKTEPEKFSVWTKPKDDKRLDNLLKEGNITTFNPTESYNSAFSLVGYTEAVKLMDNKCNK